MGQTEVERSVLGAILLDHRFYKQAAELRPKDFSLDSHRRIFARMSDLDAAGRSIDSLTLQEELSRNGDLDAIGGPAYLASLIDGVPDRPSIDDYVKMLHTAAARRSAVKLVEKAARLAEDPSVPAHALAELGTDLAQIATGAGESIAPRFSEEALALRFSRQYAEQLRYIAALGHWMRWDGMRWVKDDTLHVFDLARGICRAASAECGDGERAMAVKLASKATSAAVERLAAADRRHAATVSQWDTDVWLLNTPAGTINLRTGEVLEHRRDDYLTKMTAAGPGGDCPLWLQFLDRVTGGDRGLQSFLQRMIGYLLTGTTREHAIFFLYGTGANGKSVLLSTILGLLGDYAKTAPASSFTASTTEQHPTDLAGLRGARLVTATETEDGARWAESKIKSLTGGDRISVRFMRQDFFEYIPQFKLVIAGNHKPGLRSVDEAMRRRLHLVPFTVTIPPEDRDPSLGEKLRAEFPGILAWAIEGCLAWQQKGLIPPAVVCKATADYLAAEDAIGGWIEDRCTEEPNLWTAGSALFGDYKTCCEKTGERPMSQKRFTQALEARGFVQARTAAARGFAGIGFRRDMTHVTDSPVIAVTGARGRPI